MSYNGSGTYVPPGGNPVVSGTIIQASWANTLVTDIGNTFNVALPRDGQAPMTGTLKIQDGSVTTPGIAFNSESNSGLFRPAINNVALAVSGIETIRFKSDGSIGILGANYGTSGQYLTSAGPGAAAYWKTQADSPSPGAVFYFAMTTPPTGYLKANGAAISRTTYAALFAAIGTTWGAGDGSTTFNVPDLRGVHIRGYDDARGIDSGRTFASFQDSQNLSHSHTATDSGHNHTINDPTHSHGVNDPGHSHTYLYPDAGAGILAYGAGGAAAQSHATSGSGTGIWLSGAYTGIYNSASSANITVGSNGGSETRVKNYALLACIKY